eukprot:TRINITY_DN51682_c0_g1_i1.p1 TRINITY_DN51682_c0_g1~~TRINITY_DN51682_c0_g1_i1.p1  ORF type:complete len:180 (+),score=35.65 TRINITY_DN51682_c0_g1_i1:64-603(+)
MASFRPGRRAPRCAAVLVLGVCALLLGSHAFLTPGTTGQLSGRRDVLWKVLAPVVVAGTSGVQEAKAKQLTWSGKYSDPNHPGCERKVTKSGDQFIITGTDSATGKSGCESTDKLKKWQLSGVLVNDNTMTIDFSPKGGPEDLLATRTSAGISFPDGNTWTKASSTATGFTYTDGPSSR